MKSILTALAAALLLSLHISTLAGGPFDDAVAAYDKGDYKSALQLAAAGRAR